MNPYLILLALFLYWIYPYWPPPKVTNSSKFRHHRLWTYPDASLVLPRFYLVFYQFLIGQLNYLTSFTHLDIQFATHQCSHFSIDPKHCHEVAAKRIMCYLKRTANKGITMIPDKCKGFECYIDANFASTFNKLNASNPTSCLS